MLNTDDNARLEFSAPHTVLRNQSYEIARSLADIQHSPFRDLVFAVPTNERHRSIQDGVATVMEARRLRLAALEAWNREEPLRALETLADARSLDPTSLRLYWEATDVPRKLPAMALDIPQVRAVLDRLARIREPTIASRRGQSLDEIAGLVLSAAGQATAVGNWAAAADYLAEAQQLVPDSTEVALQRAAALAQAGQTRAAIAVLDDLLRRAADHGMANYLRATLAVTVNDQDGAIAHLQVALRSGAVTPEMLADDEILAPLRRDPRFMKLLENR
jgi:tetratricopeptide (TPR) repeat protein